MALEIARRGSIDEARSIYCGTFSKVLSPGLRVGWIVAPQAMIRRLVLVKQASDLNNSTINQMVMHRLAETAYDAQVERARAHYRRRRDAMLAALERHMPEGVTWTRPKGGLFVWVRLPEGVDAAEPARPGGQGGGRRLRAGRGILPRRPRPQHPAPELLARDRGRDRGRASPGWRS